ncbi:MAG: tyrosine-type recombinase/integrase [Oscillospiraceae bacterium]|nr:tyrosine-type recombinase/integrase [Oscillospiraceae bacterium]
MLTQCPECELPVSDKAFDCPHCGYPLKNGQRSRRSTKRKRLPNGFGQISEIKNKNLRNPFRAMVTVGHDEKGRPICKTLKPDGYFKTYNDAYAALVEYNKNPYDLNEGTTMKELYEKWSADYFKTIADSSTRAITASWKYCHGLYDIPVRMIRTRHIKTCLDTASIQVGDRERPASDNTKSNIKSLLNQMLDYAVEYEYTDKNYARSVRLSADTVKGTATQKEHIAYTDDEMETLWENITDPCVCMVVIQCYSGWRPNELLNLKLENINLEDWSFTGGLKTDAGINRTVPIHSRIQPLVREKYDAAASNGDKYLFQMTYRRYNYMFEKVRQNLGLNPNHRLHDARVQFVTMAKKYNVDEYAIKYLVGHAINDITEKTYSEREFSWFREEIEKIR